MFRHVRVSHVRVRVRVRLGLGLGLGCLVRVSGVGCRMSGVGNVP